MRIKESQRRRHSGWARGYLRDRAEYGAYNRLMRDLKHASVHDIRNMLISVTELPGRSQYDATHTNEIWDQISQLPDRQHGML